MPDWMFYGLMVLVVLLVGLIVWQLAAHAYTKGWREGRQQLGQEVLEKERRRRGL